MSGFSSVSTFPPTGALYISRGFLWPLREPGAGLYWFYCLAGVVVAGRFFMPHWCQQIPHKASMISSWVGSSDFACAMACVCWRSRLSILLAITPSRPCMPLVCRFHLTTYPSHNRVIPLSHSFALSSWTQTYLVWSLTSFVAFHWLRIVIWGFPAFRTRKAVPIAWRVGL